MYALHREGLETQLRRRKIEKGQETFWFKFVEDCFT